MPQGDKEFDRPLCGCSHEKWGSWEVVGHVPHSISTLCSLFIERGGNIKCEVTGNRQYSYDLPQGGLELPCKLVFFGPNMEIAKVKYLLQFAPCGTSCDIKSDSSLPSMKRVSPTVSAAGDAPVVSVAVGNSVLSRSYTFPSNSMNFVNNAANSMVMSSGDSGNSVTASNSAASFITISSSNSVNAVTVSNSPVSSISMSSGDSENSVTVSNSAAYSITISSRNSVNSAAVSDSPASSIMMSSGDSENSVTVSNSAGNSITISSSNPVNSATVRSSS